MATTQVTATPVSSGTRPAGPPPGSARPPAGQATPPRPDGAPRVAPATAPQALPPGPRKVRLTVARVDPWSVLKLSFLLSVAIGIGFVTASVILWSVLNGMGVFDSLNEQLRDAMGEASGFNIYEYVGLERAVSLATVIAVINVIVLMALATLGSVLYNLSSSLVGGLVVTLSDD